MPGIKEGSAIMATLEELERRLSALEQRVTADERKSDAFVGFHEASVDAISELTRRIAALELVVKANARTTELGFANMELQITTLRRDMPGIVSDALRADREGRE
jgi:hypothetical protein